MGRDMKNVPDHRDSSSLYTRLMTSSNLFVRFAAIRLTPVNVCSHICSDVEQAANNLTFTREINGVSLRRQFSYHSLPGAYLGKKFVDLHVALPKALG